MAEQYVRKVDDLGSPGVNIKYQININVEVTWILIAALLVAAYK